MTPDATTEIHEMINLLASDSLQDRVQAIDALGNSGNPIALKALRDHLDVIEREMQALITAVGKLRKALED